MTIPQLSKKIHSSPNQNWRKPTYNKKNSKKRSKNNFSISKRYKKGRPKKRIISKIVRLLLPAVILLTLIGGIFILIILAWISKDLPTPDGVINREVTVSTKIYDNKGKTVLYDIHGNIKRTLVDLDKIPQHVIDATLAAEDRDFFKHSGFSLTGIIRSIIVNITTGSKVGGSTLTQQFVKNAVLTTEKTYTRKIKELLISYRIEKKFTKKEILQMYFNEIPYGSVIYGVEAASQTFFGKPVDKLTIAEGAIIAAIPKAPTFYSPYGSNRDRLITRQRWIIDSMAKLGMITNVEAEAAKQEKIVFKPLKESIIAPHFVMYVRELLSEKYGEAFITQEGLKVYTSLDLEKQKIAEDAIKTGIEQNGKNYNFTNASLVSIDPTNGQIVAMVGSADFFNEKIDGQVNVALRLRQPGSSFKPIVYAASFIKGYTPDTILYDVVTDFDASEKKEYAPKNYDLEEHGPVTIRKALAGSLNIPAVKTTYLTGIDNVINLARDMGYTSLEDKNRFGLSLVLGGGEVKLLEHVGAYTVFSQEGIKHEITPILKIEDKNGRVLFEAKDKSKRVMDKEIAQLINNILSDDNAREYVFGLGSKLTLPNRQVAAKTGTTNDYRDAWTIGYTPELVTGVWVGNNDNTEMKRGAAGGVVAAPIWNQYMTEALKNTSPTTFTEPEKIETGKPVLDGQKVAEIKVKIDTISGKLATEFTPKSTTKEISVRDSHNILYYVNKDDPRGSRPDSPENDPQFDNWEKAVIKWNKEQGFNNSDGQKIPTEYDDVHFKKDKPNLIIIKPSANQKITNNNLEVNISANANRGIDKVKYYIDGKLLDTKNNTSNTILDLSTFDNGYHSLTVKVEDDLKNTKTESIQLNFSLPEIIPVLNWVSPINNSEVQMPINISGVITNWERAKKIDFYYKKENEDMEHYLTYINPSEAQISFKWDKNIESGNYIIYGNIFDIINKKYKTEKLRITVK